MLSGSAITFALKITGLLLSYLVAMMISKSYGADGVGLYNLSQRIIRSLAIVCALGFNISVLRYVGEFNTKPNRGTYLKKLLSYFLQLALPISILVSIILFLYANEIALNVFENKDYDGAIKIIAAVLPFFTLNLISVEFIRGLKLLKVSEFLRSVSIYLMVIILLSLTVLHYGILNPIYALAIGISITFLGAIIFIIVHVKKLPTGDEKVNFNKKEFVKTSLPMMVITISSFVLAFSGIFFLELFSTTDIVGIYSICIMLSQLVSMALTVVNTISAPKFSELFWSHKIKELKKVLHHSSKLIFWSSIVISIVLIGLSEYILALFGEEFVKGQTVLIILIAGQIINATTGSVGVFMNMTGNQKILRNIIVLTAIMIVVGYYFIVPKYGMVGAALISVCGTAIINIISALYVYKKLNFTTFYLPFLKTKNE